MSQAGPSRFLMVVLGVIMLTGCESSAQEPPTQQPPAGAEAADNESPVTIYYALNESHSNSWVQQSAEGVVGIVLYTNSPASPPLSAPGAKAP